LNNSGHSISSFNCRTAPFHCIKIFYTHHFPGCTSSMRLQWYIMGFRQGGENSAL